MLRAVLTIAALAAVAGPAGAWNNKGHMVVARLAWKELTPAERTKVIKILAAHPHLDEFLRDDRPSNIAEDEWVFMRAATWADWVRSGPPARKKFHEANRHFTNIPFAHPAGSVEPPGPAQMNVVVGLTKAKQEVLGGGDQVKRAVELTWIFHLVGDIHQPLHCAALFGPDFPHGDRGGTRAKFRSENKLVQLHSFWDGLLGQSTSLSSIGSTVLEIDTLLKDFPDVVKSDLENHKTFEAWATEGFETAKKHSYLNGKLPLVNVDDDPDVTDIEAFRFEHFRLDGYTSHPHIKAQVSV